MRAVAAAETEGAAAVAVAAVAAEAAAMAAAASAAAVVVVAAAAAVGVGRGEDNTPTHRGYPSGGCVREGPQKRPQRRDRPHRPSWRRTLPSRVEAWSLSSCIYLSIYLSI